MELGNLDAVTAAATRPTGSVERLMRLAAADMKGVDALIRARMQSPVSVIPELADHLINAGGKRLRPLIAVASARLAGEGRFRVEAGRGGGVRAHGDPAA